MSRFTNETVYMNHSCVPTCRVDTTLFVLIAERDLPPGSEITFFYPSSEWEMAQPFECWCGGDSCLKFVKGASQMPSHVFNDRFVNQHIQEMLKNNSNPV